MKTKLLFLLILFGWSNYGFAQTIVGNGSCDLGLTILDKNCLDVSLNIGDAPNNALGQDVFLTEVRLLINHRWRNDIQVHLTAPDGITTVTLINERGGSADHFGDITAPNCSNPIILTSSTCTSDSIKNVASSTLAYGLFIPEEPLENFYLPTPINPNGTWMLQVCDDKFGDVGALEYVELIFEPIGCPAPNNVETFDIQGTTANLLWNNAGTCQSSIVVEYGPSGFEPSNGITSNSESSTVKIIDCTESFPLQDLSELTYYDVYVRQICPDFDYAYNSCKVTFRTDCILPPITLFENFDTQESCGSTGGDCIDCPTLDGLWTNNTADDIDWTLNVGPTISSATGPDNGLNDTQYIYVESSSTCRPNKEAILTSNCLEIIADEGICHLSFYYHMFGSNVNELNLEISANNGMNWQNLWKKTGNQNNEWIKEYIDLSDYHGQLAQIRFRGLSAAVGFRGDIGLEDITFYGSKLSDQKVYADIDGDGFGDKDNFIFTCELDGYVLDSTDCDDSNAAIFPTHNPIYESICPDGSFEFNGQTLTDKGIYLDTLIDQYGCDSFIILNLTIDNGDPANAGEDQVLCSNFTVLNAFIDNTAIGSWSIISGDGLHQFSNPESSRSAFSGSFGESYTLEWLVFDKRCFLINRDTLNIQFGTNISMDGDNDGIADCDDLCPNGDDKINTDGAGMPDACDCDPLDPSDEFVIENGMEQNEYKISSGDYQASFSLASKGMIDENEIVFFKAGYEITLLPGFHAEVGAQFHAEIAACTSNAYTPEIPATERITTPIIETVQEVSTINDLTIAPNPFYQSTTIKYTLSENTEVSLHVFGMGGQLVQELITTVPQSKGAYEYTFEPKMYSGNVYFAVLVTAEEVLSKKMIFIR